MNCIFAPDVCCPVVVVVVVYVVDDVIVVVVVVVLCCLPEVSMEELTLVLPLQPDESATA